MLNPRTVSFGGTAAVVTSMGLIIGLGTAAAQTATIVSALLIVAVADNISDSLSIHMYQEAENLGGRTAFGTTLANFAARFLVALTFIIIVLVLPDPYAAVAALAWGFLLLAGLSYLVARARNVRPLPEVSKHLGIAVLAIAASRAMGAWILHYVH